MEKNNFLNIFPMLLSEKEKPFNNKNYIYEIKFDGIRALVYINDKEITIKSRNGIILNNIYPELLNLKNMTKETCIFDGEIVLMENNKQSFFRLMERFKIKNKNKAITLKEKYPVTFVCFDILYKNKDLTDLPLIKRKKILDKFNDTNIFLKSKYFLKDGIKLYNIIKKNDLEGIIAKEKNSKYYPNTRSKEWIKIKNYKIEEFYIGGYINKKNKSMVIVYLAEKINQKFFFVGKTSLNKKSDEYQKIIKEKIIKNSPFENYNEAKCNYINPKIKVKVNYIQRTKNNHLREGFIK